MVERATDAILVLQDGCVAYWNGGYADRLGFTREELTGQPFLSLIVPEQRAPVAANYLRRLAGDAVVACYDVDLQSRTGAIVTMEIRPSRIDFRGGPAVLVVMRETTARRQLEQQLTDLAARDPLTGLWNRRHFFDAFMHWLETGGSQGALLVADLDAFKQVNDRFGHLAGDQVLCTVAQRWQQTLGAEGTLARIGGDEFAALLPAVTPREGRVTAEALLDALTGPVRVDGADVTPRASVGIATRGAGATADALMAAADAAMYAVKRSGGGGVIAA
jgi:diguanylate cyclase (GGDEF)-like protein/PAS domain S-box-containing protein